MADHTFMLSELFVPKLTMELAKTRTSLERVPDSEAAFRPHERSMTLLDLCNHLATVSGLTGTILRVDGANLGGPDDPRRAVKEQSTAELLTVFDEFVASSLEMLEATSDERFHANWQARRGETILFSGTRYLAFRNIGVHHMIHHRAQLGVYLRQLEIPVPALFGPSADEA